MIYRIVIILLSLMLSLPVIASSVEEPLNQKFTRIQQIIDENGYTEEVCHLFHTIASPEKFNELKTKLEANQLLLLSEFLRDEKRYEDAALGFIAAVNKGLKDRHVITYLQTIGEESDLDIISLMKKSERNEKNKRKVIENLVKYWQKSEDLLNNLSNPNYEVKNSTYEALSIASYFTSKSSEYPTDNDLTNMKLQKLCCYAQGHYLAFHDRPLFNDSIQAWIHGPVIPSVYHYYKEYRDSPIPPTSLDEDCYNKEIREFLDYIYDLYGKFSAWKLSDMTHNDSYWLNTKSGKEIPLDSMRSHFKELIEK